MSQKMYSLYHQGKLCPPEASLITRIIVLSVDDCFTTLINFSLDGQREIEEEVWESTTLNNEIFIMIDLMIWYKY